MLMAKSRRSRKKRKKSSSSIGTALSVIGAFAVLIALVGAGVFLSMNTEKEISLDKDSLCPKTGVRGTVAVLLDTTDELALVTKNEVKDKILEIQKTLPRFYQVSVYTLDETGLNEKPVASICNPGRLDQRDELAQQGLTANPVLIERKYGEFESVIFIAIDRVFEKEFGAKQSPLLASLQELSVVIPNPIDIDDDLYFAGKNKIVFITDFLEHTEIFSNYRSGLNFEEFQKSRATEKFGKSYNNVEFELLMVRRNIEQFSTLDLAKFWAKVFKQEFKANIRSLKILSGEI